MDASLLNSIENITMLKTRSLMSSSTVLISPNGIERIPNKLVTKKFQMVTKNHTVNIRMRS